jgi:hypothetical protein
MRRIRERAILVATSDSIDVCDAIVSYAVNCVLWLTPTFNHPESTLARVAAVLEYVGGYQMLTADAIQQYGPKAHELYKDGLLDLSESTTVAGIPDSTGRMTWHFSLPTDELQEMHSLYVSPGFGCHRVNDFWQVFCNKNGFWVIQKDQAPIPVYQEVGNDN